MTRENPRQQLFVFEFLECWVAAKAAVRAGYSQRRAKQTGCELLRRPEIRDAVVNGMQARLDELCSPPPGVGASLLLARCREAGVDVTLEDDGLKLLHHGHVPSVLLSALMSRKHAIADLLKVDLQQAGQTGSRQITLQLSRQEVDCLLRALDRVNADNLHRNRRDNTGYARPEDTAERKLLEAIRPAGRY